jgi:hypothetical protein
MLILEDVGFVPVDEDTTVWCVFGKKVLQPHLRVARLAEPASVGMAVEAVDGNDAVRYSV